MAYYEKQTITLTIDSSGDATEYSRVVNGAVRMIHYDGGLSDTTTDVLVTSEDTGVVILSDTSIGTSAVAYIPKMAAHASADGTTITAANAEDAPPVASERVKFVMDNGTENEVAVFTLIIEGTIAPSS